MKKVITFLMTTVLIFMLTVGSFAGDYTNCSDRMSVETFTVGNKVTVTVSIDEFYGIQSGTVYIAYDHDKLEYADGRCGVADDDKSICAIGLNFEDEIGCSFAYVEASEVDRIELMSVEFIAKEPCETSLCVYGYTEYGAGFVNGVFDKSVNEYGVDVELKVDVLPGDVNFDGKITAADAREALQGAVNITELTAEQYAAADIDGDDRVSVSDARCILKMAVNVE